MCHVPAHVQLRFVAEYITHQTSICGFAGACFCNLALFQNGNRFVSNKIFIMWWKTA
ncbi:hypothetical protein HMPREF9248_0282 [Fannyhessea vaginae PB189-T1-4]|uniref:Uncharacterized protein n=1 Tax=Fannyhessea vaginae PB189-T1-4 TaxID=866774 RepID=A0ABP2IYL2_9ACTN|nr:hypothetical protein HMPREF9248_0282 [Fannyhessea vaginae PB189-T1-4]